METIFRICAGLLFEFLLYGTAKIVLPIISFGKVQAKEYKEFNVPYDDSFLNKQEGHFSIGQVPNADEIEAAPIEAEKEFYRIKDVNSKVFEVPQHLERLVPSIQLAAAFEAAHADNFRQKAAVLILRDRFQKITDRGGEMHRDPPDLEEGRAQNIYSFTNNHPTIFPGHRRANPYEMICFTAASPHRRPGIRLQTL